MNVKNDGTDIIASFFYLNFCKQDGTSSISTAVDANRINCQEKCYADIIDK